MPKIIMVGDSTVASFNDVSYYYPRYGYGTQMDKYFNLEVINLALSGRSSKSYLSEPNYQEFKRIINEGDFVFIGFGHNDEKDDDIARFTSAKVGFNNPLSFPKNLYDNYIKVAQDLGANPILCTPIPRLDLKYKYEGNDVHDTKNGNYRNAIIKLADSKNIPVIDLTNKIKDLSIELGKSQILLHAISKGKMEYGQLVYDGLSVDKTHLSYLGALVVAYNIAKTAKENKLPISKYLKDNVNKPCLQDLTINPNYKYRKYETPNLENYKPNDNFIKEDPYYGTAFGEIKNIDSYIAKKDNDNFIVGTKELVGKINASQEGYAYLFRRIDKKYNFQFSAHAKVISTLSVRQAGFGLMLRSDAYINQEEPNINYNTNYITASLLTTDKVTYANFSRSNPTELDKGEPILASFYELGDELDLSIIRLGQVVNVKLIYKNKTYERQFVDFDYLSKDLYYIFVGMFSTSGTLVEFSNVQFKLNGLAKEA